MTGTSANNQSAADAASNGAINNANIWGSALGQGVNILAAMPVNRPSQRRNLRPTKPERSGATRLAERNLPPRSLSDFRVIHGR